MTADERPSCLNNGKVITRLKKTPPEKRFEELKLSYNNQNTLFYRLIIAHSCNPSDITLLLKELSAHQCADLLFDTEYGTAKKLAQNYTKNPYIQGAFNALIEGITALRLSEEEKDELIVKIVKCLSGDAKIPPTARAYFKHSDSETVGALLGCLQSQFTLTANSITVSWDIPTVRSNEDTVSHQHPQGKENTHTIK